MELPGGDRNTVNAVFEYFFELVEFFSGLFITLLTIVWFVLQGWNPELGIIVAWALDLVGILTCIIGNPQILIKFLCF